MAESVLSKHQLLILSRSRRRAPNLRTLDRLAAGFYSLWISPRRLRRVAIAFRPSALLNFHRVMAQRKYRLLFSPKRGTKPGPKGPTADLIQAVVEMKQRNPTWYVRKSPSRSIWLSEHLLIIVLRAVNSTSSTLPFFETPTLRDANDKIQFCN